MKLVVNKIPEELGGVQAQCENSMSNSNGTSTFNNCFIRFFRFILVCNQ